MPAPVTRLLYVAVTRAKETLYVERPLARRFGLDRFEHQDATIAADPEIVVPPVSAEPDYDVIEPVRASHVRDVHETYPVWSDSIRAHVDESETPQRAARESAYDRYGGFAIGIALGLFVVIAFDFIRLISL
jgi:ATP-dependent exoDNAse (exonuclease V) beta subunit